MTTISVEDVRLACGITKPIVPEQLYESEIYDKWGNNVLANGQRLRGELYFDESVQKILKEGGVFDNFTNRVKYPRTWHVPDSPGMHDDDRMIPNYDRFVGEQVVVHLKMDGENTTMYSDYIHARSIDGRSHPSRDWIKSLHGLVAHEIPPDYRLSVENMYAQHSIVYNNLKSYAYGFSVWNERNECLPWTEAKEWFELLNSILADSGLPPHMRFEPCPVLYEGIFDRDLILKLYNEKTDWETMEGWVMRKAGKFSYADYRYSVAKFVRKGHVQTNKHWMHGQAIIPNKLLVES